MTEAELRSLAMEKLLQVAPDIDPDELDPKIPVRDQYDFDSMDFLNFAIALAKEFQLNIPEKDYPHLQSLQDTVDYLVKHTGKHDAPN